MTRTFVLRHARSRRILARELADPPTERLSALRALFGGLCSYACAALHAQRHLWAGTAERTSTPEGLRAARPLRRSDFPGGTQRLCVRRGVPDALPFEYADPDEHQY